ncbi:ComEA family DNA-binding protein [Nocardia wallacei]|uniref:ComEA family DNA-binding protein n=1 Tax=Nocardia wallacei TaxID=480035 RepID=UPI002458133F|nr:ComEA family DNA-binding protein [Nocardia wallacei]
MAGDEERRRVRERLGAIASEPRGTRSVPGGRWDLDELDGEDPEFDDDADRLEGEGPRRAGSAGGGRDEAEGPRMPHWLREPGGEARWHERVIPERWRGTRLDPGRRGVLVLIAAGVAAVILAAAAVQRESPVAQPVPPLPAVRTSAAGTNTATAPEPTGRAAESSTAPPSGRSELVVSVIGLVEHPGLLHLPSGSRVADALAVAVAQDGADLGSLNLAQRLADGDQVVVGAVAPQPGPPRVGSVVIPGGQRPAAPGGTSGAAAPSGPAARVDLNTATEAELDALPGVGPATALAILAWRTEHGRFTSVDQLAEVTGIGPTRLNRLRNLVTV